MGFLGVNVECKVQSEKRKVPARYCEEYRISVICVQDILTKIFAMLCTLNFALSLTTLNHF